MLSGKNNKLIKLSKSCLSDLEKSAVLKVLDKEFLGMGPEVNKFEKKLNFFFDRESVCVVNGTASLQLAIQSIGVKKEDEILVPSLTYVANFQAITANEAKPVACDIDKKTLTLDISDTEKKITSKTKAIMPVHYAGGVGNLKEIYKLANINNLRVIEDASHAFGTIYNNKLVGSTGDIVCFSFDGIKNITSGEGGCIVSEDKELIEKIKNLRLLGIENETKKYPSMRSWNFEVNYQGWRYHMSDIMASIGIIQLERFNELSKKRKYLAKYYDELLKNNKLISFFDKNYDLVVPHLYPVRVLNLKDRENLRKKLLDIGIETGYHYLPNHYLSYFKEYNDSKLVNTDAIFPELLSLPLHPDIEKKDIDFIVESLIKIIPDYVYGN